MLKNSQFVFHILSEGQIQFVIYLHVKWVLQKLNLIFFEKLTINNNNNFIYYIEEVMMLLQTGSGNLTHIIKFLTLRLLTGW